MAQVLQIIIGILVLIAIPTAIIINLKLNKQLSKVEVTANMPLVSNPARMQFTNGYASGVLKRERKNKNGTSLIEFYPDDVEQGEGIPRPEVQGVVVKEEFIKRLAIGDLGTRRQRYILVGRSALDYPEKLRGTPDGDWMSKEGQLAFLKATFGKQIPAGDEALAEMMKSWSRTGVTKGIMAEIKEANAQFRKMMPFQQKEGESTETKKGG